MHITDSLLDFVSEHAAADPYLLKLKLRPENYDFDLDFALLQIAARQKTRQKLASFISNPGFIFPDALSAEQASHQAVAHYHSLSVTEGSTLLDMSAGLGIDAMAAALAGASVTAVEINPDKAEALAYNARMLNLRDFKVVCDDSVRFLENLPGRFDIIYIDPARRDASHRRLYNFHDCSPDVIALAPLLLQKAHKIVIKGSPMLDITESLHDFHNIHSIKAIGVKGECKEILLQLSLSDSLGEEIQAEAINLDNEGNIISSFSTLLSRTKRKEPNLMPLITEEEIEPGHYLMEPSPMVMKLSPWRKLCEKFKARQLSPSSHLFLSEHYPGAFPGRVTRIERIIKKSDRKSLAQLPATVVSRNHPLSADEIRKSLKLREGDQNFIYASRIGAKPLMIQTFKI